MSAYIILFLIIGNVIAGKTRRLSARKIYFREICASFRRKKNRDKDKEIAVRIRDE